MTVATHDPHWAQVGKNRVAKLMRKACLRGLSNGPYPEGTQRPATRRRYVVTTERNKRERPAPDLVNRKFIATAPHQLWVAERLASGCPRGTGHITYVSTWAGFVFLAVVLDVWGPRPATAARWWAGILGNRCTPI